MKTGSVSSLAIAVALLAVASNGQNERTVVRRSADGTQQGSITLSSDSMRGTVSSSSQGTERAFASSSLVIGPGTSEGSFTAAGDSQQVSDTLSVDPQQDEVDPVVVDTPEANTAEAAVVVEQSSVEVPETKQEKASQEPEVAPEESDDIEEVTKEEPRRVEQEAQPRVVQEEQPRDVPRDIPSDGPRDGKARKIGRKGSLSFSSTSTSSSGGTKVVFTSSGSNVGSNAANAKKICLVGDDTDFRKKLNEGYEVTLIQVTADRQVKITTALEWPTVSTKHSVVSRYIPDEIRERCNVDYADLGLENRGDGGASLSSSGSSYHFTSSSGSSHVSTDSNAIRKRVLGRLCDDALFRNFALFDECTHHRSGDIGDDDFPWR